VTEFFFESFFSSVTLKKRQFGGRSENFFSPINFAATPLGSPQPKKARVQEEEED